MFWWLALFNSLSAVGTFISTVTLQDSWLCVIGSSCACCLFYGCTGLDGYVPGPESAADSG
jgi:hypothetical protein